MREPTYEWTGKVSCRQWSFLQLPQRFAAFIGGRGSGKTFAGVLKAIELAGACMCTGLVVAPTYPMLEDVAIPAFKQQAQPIIADFNKSRHQATLVNGSVILFRSADNAEVLRGLSVSWAWLDEAALLKEIVWRIILPTLREYGRPGRAYFTTTPRGKNWLYARFCAQAGETPEQRRRREAGYGLVHATTGDNPFLSQDIVDDLTADYGVGWFAKQEINGEFVDPEGSLFRREWFEIVDQAPPLKRVCRGWDLACTTKASSDYTVGVRLGEAADGTYYVLDVVRGRWEWPQAELVIAQTCAADGKGSRHWVERTGMQTAAVQGLLAKPELKGYAINGRPADRDKLSNALPVASRAQAGRVKLVRGMWNAAFLDEFCAFTGDPKDCVHDDQVDGTSIAYHSLARGLPTVTVI